MATVSILCKYCSLLVVLSSLCFLPLCYSGKMRRKPNREGRGIMRSIKILDRRYTRKVQAAASPEEFVKLFQPKLVERTALDAGTFVNGPTGLLHRRLHLQEASNETLDSVIAKLHYPRCLEPRPVILDAYEVIGISKGRLQWISPDCIEVNRCGPQSGCCSESMICSVVEGGVRNVSKTILIGSVHFGDSMKDRESGVGYYNVQVEEHTACECRPDDQYTNLRCERPKMKDPVRRACVCPQRCPNPYIADETCGCNCSTEKTVAGRACRKIYRGKEVMLEKECQCVRSHQCSPPICRNKYIFNNVTCTCTRKPSDSERITDQLDELYTEELFKGEMEVRAMGDTPPSKIPVEAGRLEFSPVVRSMGPLHQFKPKKGLFTPSSGERSEDPKLGNLLPDSEEYRHSSHTSYNDTFDVGVYTNTSRSTTKKTKIAPWEKSGDELNATFIKDENAILVTPNDTEHETIANQVTPGESHSEVLPNTLPERTGTSIEGQGEDVNVINAFGPDDFSNDSFRGYDLDSSPSSDYSSKFSYSSSSDDIDEEDKSEYDVFEAQFRGANDDRDTYESSGDDLAGY